MDYNALNEVIGIKPKSDEPLKTLVEVSTPEQFQAIIACNSDEHIRKAYLESLSLPELPKEYAVYNEILGNLYGYRDKKTFSDEFLAFIKKVFPVYIKVLIGKNVVIDKDMTIGPDALPYVINADTLTFSGGSITALTTTVTINANQLQIIPPGYKHSTKPYHIGILGVKGTDGYKGADGVPYSSPAHAGRNSSAPSPGICSGAASGGNGSNGELGTSGKKGGNGENGRPNGSCNLTIKSIDPDYASSFVIYTKSGSGGNGGIGGTGGQGQDGGAGGHGCESGCECTNGGNGGNGGVGGTGGDGGTGGNGVDGNPIIITFPGASKDLLKPTKDAAPFGTGGTPGNGGDGGNGGSGGKTRSNCSAGTKGGKGKFGTDGKRGTDGTVSGSPGNYIFKYT